VRFGNDKITIFRASAMEDLNQIDGYQWVDSELTGAHNYLAPRLKSILLAEREASKGENRLFDLGCGNGAIAAVCSDLGFDVTGIDPSREGIAQAQSAFPHLKLERGSAYDDVVSRFGRFDYVVSLEVVEHVFAPRKYAATLYSLCKENGVAIVSTPYHGYWKNMALALAGNWDFHFTALWDCGHIKFWSIKTLSILLQEAGFRDIVFYRVGRIPPLAKSMIAVARR
jgi:2-polyprenyl-6-hydroxyphenyl methylase/3-demethylubiquinone-9 3-methyltransferase